MRIHYKYGVVCRNQSTADCSSQYPANEIVGTDMQSRATIYQVIETHWECKATIICASMTVSFLFGSNLYEGYFYWGLNLIHYTNI